MHKLVRGWIEVRADLHILIRTPRPLETPCGQVVNEFSRVQEAARATFPDIGIPY